MYALLVTTLLVGQESGTDLQKMLDSIPSIETPAPAEPEVPPEEVDAGIDLPTYVARVSGAVLANWHPSAKLVEKEPRLATHLLVRIAEDGAVTGASAVLLSGNRKFDRSCLEAINATASVLAPPVSLRGTAADGVIVKFLAAKAPK